MITEEMRKYFSENGKKSVKKRLGKLTKKQRSEWSKNMHDCYWGKMTPEQRREEMLRRMRKAVSK